MGLQCLTMGLQDLCARPAEGGVGGHTTGTGSSLPLYVPLLSTRSMLKALAHAVGVQLITHVVAWYRARRAQLASKRGHPPKSFVNFL